jgi:putative transcriptional regulator
LFKRDKQPENARMADLPERGKTVNNHIEERRKERGLTQQALARELGVSRQTIISLEGGRYNPSIMLAHKIAAVFETTIEEIFIFEEDDHE